MCITEVAKKNKSDATLPGGLLKMDIVLIKRKLIQNHQKIFLQF